MIQLDSKLRHFIGKAVSAPYSSDLVPSSDSTPERRTLDGGFEVDFRKIFFLSSTKRLNAVLNDEAGRTYFLFAMYNLDTDVTTINIPYYTSLGLNDNPREATEISIKIETSALLDKPMKDVLYSIGEIALAVSNSVDFFKTKMFTQ